jgi:methylated-DNA-protein-cysteine methyltransferase related protein
MVPESPQQRTDFFERVYDVVRKIPLGRVTTYGHIAAHLGMRSSARMVGWALNAVGYTDRQYSVPAHRVVNRLGELSGRMHFETPFVMRERLESEGVPFVGDRVDISVCLWDPSAED